MPLKPPVTISAILVGRMIAPLRDRPHLLDAAFETAGLELSTLDKPDAGLPAERVLTMYLDLLAALGDEAVGLFRRPVRPRSFALIANATLGADDLHAALRRLCHAVNLLQDDMVLSCVEDGSAVGVAITAPPGWPQNRNFAFELLFMVTHRLLAWLKAGKLEVSAVEFIYPRPQHAHEIERLFSAPARFSAPQSVLWFDRTDLAAPLRRSALDMREYLAHAMRNIVLPMARSETMAERVREYLKRRRPDWPGLTETAEAFHVSTSALQRYLALENQSFRSIKDGLRRDLATDLLTTTPQSLDRIAAELGFADSAGFQRAYKHWTGTAPGALRRHDTALR